jgi:hypothetical protein
LEGNALRIVCLEPSLRGFGIGEGLDVIGMADAVSGVDVNPNGFSLERLPDPVLFLFVF